MTTEDPTPEAIEFANAIDSRPYGYRRDAVALALDAWGAALLAKQGYPFGCSPDMQSRLRAQIARADAAEALASKRGVAALKSELLEEQRNKADLKAAHVAECERRDATRAELEATRKELGQLHNAYAARLDELADTRKELEQRNKDNDWNCGMAAAARAELESLRKPLEGELAEDVKRLREGLPLDGSYSREANAALDRIVAALRAKPQGNAEPLDEEPLRKTWLAIGEVDRKRVFYDHPRLFTAIEAALRAKGEPQAAEPPEPRAIVVGSRVRMNYNGASATTIRRHPELGWEVQFDNGATDGYYPDQAVTWLSDPEPAPPAPEPK